LNIFNKEKLHVGPMLITYDASVEVMNK